MKAMVLEKFNKPLKMKNVDIPKIGTNDILLKVKACGICGTDLKIVTGKIPSIKLPHIPGHEISGEIVEIGEGVKFFKKGDRTVSYIYDYCGKCKECLSGHTNLCKINKKRIGFELPGGLAEYVRIPSKNAIKIPRQIGYEEASVLTDSVVTSLHAMEEKAKINWKDVVLIIGIGGLGINQVQIAKLWGASVFACDIREDPLKIAKDFGADLVINSSGLEIDEIVDRIKKMNSEKGVNVVLDNVGSEKTINLSLNCLERGGRLVSIGYVPGEKAKLDLFKMHMNEWQVIGTRYSTIECLFEAVELVRLGKLKPYIGKILPFEEINYAYDLLSNHKVTGRIVIKI